MARPTEVTVNYSRKVQLDQFEPIEFGGSVTFEFEEGDEISEVYQNHASEIEDAVERELVRRVARKKNDSGDD
jgi:hypothetical protein